MKILVVCQHYYPDPFRITDIAENLVRAGHDVFMLTGEPSYEREKWISEGGKADEIRNGVKIHRVKTAPRGKGVLNRVRNYYSFAESSKRYVKKLDKDFDVVFVYELSPIMMAEAAIKYKKKYGTKVVLYCLDLWPKSLTAGGIKENSLVYKHYKRVSKKIYSAADQLLVTSESFKEYFFKEFGFDRDKITYLPQYAEGVYSPEMCAKIPDGKIDLMFAGNIGVAQSVETILHAAAELKNEKNLFFHIVGDGVKLKDCMHLAKKFDLQNVKFYGRLPLKEMPSMYKKADAMLITGDKGVISYTLPGKVQGYMSAAKPIVGAIDGETPRVIEKANCGFCGAALNAEELKNNILKFIATEDKKTLGDNGREFYELNFRPEKFFLDLAAAFERCQV